MDKELLKKLNEHISQTQAFDRHRKYWLMASAFVVAVILGIVFEWEAVIHAKVLWVIASLSMTTTALW